MSDSPLFLAARIASISSSAFLSAFAFSASYYSLPAISLAPITLRLQQWQVIYDLGKLVSPPLTAASGALWGWIAWTSRGSEDWKLYAVAGTVTFAVLPWTVGFMMPTNVELMRRAKAAKEDAEGARFKEESEAALKTWWWMNYVRAVLPMAGAWVGLYVALR